MSSFRFTTHFGNTALNFDRTFDAIDSAGKLQEKAVTHRFHDPPAAGFYGGVDDGLRKPATAASVPASSSPMRWLYPTISAKTIAASLRFHGALPNESTRICPSADENRLLFLKAVAARNQTADPPALLEKLGLS